MCYLTRDIKVLAQDMSGVDLENVIFAMRCRILGKHIKASSHS